MMDKEEMKEIAFEILGHLKNIYPLSEDVLSLEIRIRESHIEATREDIHLILTDQESFNNIEDEYKVDASARPSNKDSSFTRYRITPSGIEKYFELVEEYSKTKPKLVKVEDTSTTKDEIRVEIDLVKTYRKIRAELESKSAELESKINDSRHRIDNHERQIQNFYSKIIEIFGIFVAIFSFIIVVVSAALPNLPMDIYQAILFIGAVSILMIVTLAFLLYLIKRLILDRPLENSHTTKDRPRG